MNVLGDLMSAIGVIPDDWLRALGPAASPERLAPIAEFVARKRLTTSVLPDPNRVFAAFGATPFDSVRAVILGQDPYPNATHAMGLAFSVPRDLRPLPNSLRNIRTELRSDLGIVPPDHSSLEAWTRHGVLLLNTALTFHESIPASHDPAGWAGAQSHIRKQSGDGQSRHDGYRQADDHRVCGTHDDVTAFVNQPAPGFGGHAP